ncbi:MAG TPA: LytTR family DNA-binding domain-containing protein [Saprospiraceae bacterium]|nr:LytTR family DNA-binding domain-containing protein [Saprospiraceae bacterium]
MKVLIIEDEMPTALNLEKTIKEIDQDFELLGFIDTVESAINYFNTNPAPDVVFMDIQLADGKSFEIFDEVEIKCPIIFCTAFDEYAIEAFKVNGIDYLLKPFDKQSVEQALKKLNDLKAHFNSGYPDQEMMTDILHSIHKNYKTSFLVSFRDRMIPLVAEEIAYFTIEHELTFLYTFEQKKYLVSSTLEELENQLDPRMFYRANRQYLVNFSSISEVEHYFARKLLLKLKTDTKQQIVISKAKASSFINWMQKH